MPHVIENCPSTIALHVGTNSIFDKEKEPEQIAQEVIDAGKTAEQLGVTNVIISGLIVRRSGMWAERRRRQVNNILEDRCDLNNFLFSNNDNIVLEDLYEDRVHLLDSGSAKLGKNLKSAINRFN